MTDYSKLVISVDSTQVKTAGKDLGTLQKSASSLTSGLGKMMGPLSSVTDAMAALKEAEKNAGKEAGQFARQQVLAQSAMPVKSSNALADAYLTGADSVRELAIQQKIEEELLKTGAGARDKVTEAVRNEADAKDRLAVIPVIARLRDENANTLAQAAAILQGKDAVESFTITRAMTAALSGKDIAVDSVEYKQLLEQTKKQSVNSRTLEQAGKVDGIVDRLNPQIKLLKDFTAEQEALNTAIALGVGDTDLYLDTLARLGNEYEVNRSKATLWGQMTKTTVDSIDGVFAKAWVNIGAGAESLWDNLKKGFKQALGEIGHMLTTKPLLASISNWLTGTDNGQGLGAVWSKLLGSFGGSGGGLAGLFSGTSSSGAGIGNFFKGSNFAGAAQQVSQAYNVISGAGGLWSATSAGYAAGGIPGAVSAGISSLTSSVTGLASTLTSGVTSLVSSLAGNTAASLASTGVVSSAFAQTGVTLATSTGTTAASLAPVYGQAAMQLGQAATLPAASTGSAFAAWPLLVLMGMYQSGKLFDAGIRPNFEGIQESGGETALGQAAMFAPAASAKWLEFKDNLFGKVVGNKVAAMITGSTVFQAVYEKVGAKLFGSAYQLKDSGISLGVTDGDLTALQYADMKKKRGLISGSDKKKTDYTDLSEEAESGLQGTYLATQIGVAALVGRIGVKVKSDVFDGLQIAEKKITTQDKTKEEIEKAISDWFVTASDAMVAAIDNGTGGFGYTFDELARRINIFESFNASIDMINIKMLDLSAHSMELANALVVASGGTEQFATNVSTYYDKFFTETEKADDVLAAVNKQFDAMNITFPESREEYRKLVESIGDLNSEEGKKLFLSLTYSAGMASDAYDILEQRATDATAATKALADSLLANVDSAMNAVSRAVSAEREALTAAYNARVNSLNDMLQTAQSSVSSLTSVSTSLEAALKSLNGTSDDAVKMLRNQAQATLQSALATVRAGGSLAEMTGLDDALDAVSNNTTDLYSSLEDFTRDQGLTANVVAELNNINGVQLSTQEQLLKSVQDQIDAAKDQYDDEMKRLDEQLKWAQQQVDALNGIDNSVLSVKDAIAGLGTAIAAAMAHSAATSAAASPATPYTGAGGAPSASDLNSVYQSVLGRDVDPIGAAYWAGQLGSGAVTAAGLAAAIKSDGIKNGEIPALVTGGDHSGGLRLVGENGPELEVTGPSRIFNANQTAAMLNGGGNDATVDELRQLRADIRTDLSFLARSMDQTARNTGQMKEVGVQVIGTVSTRAVPA